MKRIKSLHRLAWLAEARRAVICPKLGNGKPTPAAFFIGMPGRTILNAMTRGMYLYEPKQKKGKTDGKRD